MIPRIVTTLIVFLSLVTAPAHPSAEFSQAVQALQSVGPEGRGNAPAAAAWKTLAQSRGDSLLPLLEAMDSANDFALNWLRAAVETVAAHELKTGTNLPTTELGQFLLDTRHHARPRRLAFELLARVDSEAAEKLISGMLNDPSLELRYDAVQKVIDQASRFQAASNHVGAVLLFQQALSCARDADQIDGVAKKLEELGSPPDLLKTFGFLTQWKVIGPFDNTEQKGFDAVYPPELKVDFSGEFEGKGRKARWQDYSTSDKYGKVDMNQPYGALKGVVAYAAADFVSDHTQPVEIRLGGQNSWKVWLNGQFLFGNDEYHLNEEIDQFRMPATLQSGHNTVLVKVCQNEQTEDWAAGWDFQLRVTDALGTPITSAAVPPRAEASGGAPASTSPTR